MNCAYLVAALALTVFLAHTAFESNKDELSKPLGWLMVIAAIVFVYLIPAFLWWKAGAVYGAFHA